MSSDVPIEGLLETAAAAASGNKKSTSSSIASILGSNGTLIAIAVSGVIICGLAGLIVLNYKDAALGKHARKAARVAMISRGAKLEGETFSEGPLKPGVKVSEGEVVAGIINTFMSNTVGNASGEEPTNDEPSPAAVSANVSGGRAMGYPNASHSESEAATQRAVTGSMSFADFSMGRSRNFNPHKYLKQYELRGGQDEEGEDDDDDGDSSDDGGYVDLGAKKIGKPPPFPDSPVNTNVRSSGDDYTSGEQDDVTGGRRRSRRSKGGVQGGAQPSNVAGMGTMAGGGQQSMQDAPRQQQPQQRSRGRRNQQRGGGGGSRLPPNGGKVPFSDDEREEVDRRQTEYDFENPNVQISFSYNPDA